MKPLAHFATFAMLSVCWLAALTFKPSPQVVIFLTVVTFAGLLTFLLIREET